MAVELGLTERAVELLNRPLSIGKIEQRKGGGGMMLKYLKGDTALDTANKIFGFGGWGYEITGRGEKTIHAEAGQSTFLYTCDIKLFVVGAPFTFPGSGYGIVDKPFNALAYGNAYKEAETVAIKRALRNYGDQFGLCLYNDDDLVDAGNSRLIKVSEIRFDKDGNAFAPPLRQAGNGNPQGTQQASNAQETQPAAEAERIIPTQEALKKEITMMNIISTKTGNLVTFEAFVGRILNLGARAAGNVLATRELTPGECAAIDALLPTYRRDWAEKQAAEQVTPEQEQEQPQTAAA